MHEFITNNLDLWTAALLTKSTSGRNGDANQEAYGIKKLRELILELAVRGKLVPQDPNDEPASVLLEKIAKEKMRLVEEAVVRREKSLPEISEEEKPFQIPENWEWVRLTDVYYSISPSGKKLKTSEIIDEGKYPVVDQGQSRIAGYTNDSELLIVIPGPVVIFGDHTTEIKYVDFNFVAGADGTKILRPYQMDEKYFYTYLKSYKLEDRGYARHFKVLNENFMALPPLTEQHRIVAKVDELMALCDQLEQQQNHSIEAHQTLVEILLGTLTRVESQQELSEAWTRIANHFDTLFTTENSVESLKQTILELAVMGKLSSPQKSDTPIEALLDAISIERRQLGMTTKEAECFEAEYHAAKKGIVNKRINLKARFFCGFITKGTTPSSHELLPDGDVPFLKVYNIVNNRLDFGYKPIFISNNVHQTKLKRSVIYPGDVIMNIVGPPLGKVAVVTEEYPEWNMNQALAVFRPLGGINNKYIHYMLTSGRVLKSVLSEVKGTAGQDNLSLEQCRDLLIPIPSLEEQHRIVARVDELMALSDALRARLVKAQITQIHLADAIVEQELA